jgi:hypothetical protein
VDDEIIDRNELYVTIVLHGVCCLCREETEVYSIPPLVCPTCWHDAVRRVLDDAVPPCKPVNWSKEGF